MIGRLAGIVGAGAAALMLVGTVSAAGGGAVLVNLDCGSDGTMQVIANEHSAQFAPAHIVGGGVLHPLAFQDQHTTFIDNAGNVYTFDDADVAKKGGVPANARLVHCALNGAFQDENGSGTFTGEIDAYITPR